MATFHFDELNTLFLNCSEVCPSANIIIYGDKYVMYLL